MPIYEYQCEEHGNFSYQTEISKRNDDYFCPTCGSVTKRIISAPSLSIMNDNNRQAWARNEKSAHEPQHKKSMCVVVHVTIVMIIKTVVILCSLQRKGDHGCWGIRYKIQ